MNKHKMNKIKAISLTDPVAHRRSQNFERAVHQLSESHSHRQLHWWSDLLNWRALFLQCHSARPLWLLSYYRAMSWGGGRLRCHWCRPLRWPFDCDDPRFSMSCLWMNIVYLGWEFTQLHSKSIAKVSSVGVTACDAGDASRGGSIGVPSVQKKAHRSQRGLFAARSRCRQWRPNLLCFKPISSRHCLQSRTEQSLLLPILQNLHHQPKLTVNCMYCLRGNVVLLSSAPDSSSFVKRLMRLRDRERRDSVTRRTRTNGNMIAQRWTYRLL